MLENAASPGAGERGEQKGDKKKDEEKSSGT